VENLAKYLNTKLKNEFLSNEEVAACIAIEFVKRVVDEPLKLATPLATQGKLAEILDVPISILGLVWKLLSAHYCVIKSNRGGGSFIVVSIFPIGTQLKQPLDT